MVISCDYDGTFTRSDVRKFLKFWGGELHIVTARSKSDDNRDLFNETASFRIPRKRIHFTNKQSKLPVLRRIGACVHLDNDRRVVAQVGALGVLVSGQWKNKARRILLNCNRIKKGKNV